MLTTILIASCSTPHAKDTQTGSGSASSTVISTRADLNANVGSQIAVKGMAADAKISAALQLDNGVVYCLGVQSWPATMLGKTVTARGTLAHTDAFLAKTGPDGEISQGTRDAVYVLRECQYDPL